MAGGTVLVTGASTGIGEATAHHLRDLGFDVLAGVRTEEDRDRLTGDGVRGGEAGRDRSRSDRARSGSRSESVRSPAW